MQGATGREHTSLLSKRAIRTTRRTGHRAGKPFCREPLDAEWLNIIRRLLE